MRGDRVDDVAERQQGIGDRYRDARQADDPHDDAHDVASEPGDDMRLDGHAAELRGPVARGERDHTQYVGACLKQELRAGVEEYAGHEEGKRGPGHHRLATTTRRGSRPSSTIVTPFRLSSSYSSGCMIA